MSYIINKKPANNCVDSVTPATSIINIHIAMANNWHAIILAFIIEPPNKDTVAAIAIIHIPAKAAKIAEMLNPKM